MSSDNPTNDVININCGDHSGEISINDVNGKLVFKDQVTSNNTRINTTNFQNGTYFVSLNTGDEILSSQFIKN